MFRYWNTVVHTEGKVKRIYYDKSNAFQSWRITDLRKLDSSCSSTLDSVPKYEESCYHCPGFIESDTRKEEMNQISHCSKNKGRWGIPKWKIKNNLPSRKPCTVSSATLIICHPQKSLPSSLVRSRLSYSTGNQNQMRAGRNSFRSSPEFFISFFILVQICLKIMLLNNPSVKSKQAACGHPYLAAPFSVTEVKLFLSHVHRQPPLVQNYLSILCKCLLPLVQNYRLDVLCNRTA